MKFFFSPVWRFPTDRCDTLQIPFRYPTDLCDTLQIPFRYPTDPCDTLQIPSRYRVGYDEKKHKFKIKIHPVCFFTLGKTLDHGSYQNRAQAQLLPCMGPYSNKSQSPMALGLYTLHIYIYIYIFLPLNRYPPSWEVHYYLSVKEDLTHRMKR
jgi:hypothetical protein